MNFSSCREHENKRLGSQPPNSQDLREADIYQVIILQHDKGSHRQDRLYKCCMKMHLPLLARLRESLDEKTKFVFRGDEYILTNLVKRRDIYFWWWEQVCIVLLQHVKCLGKTDAAT